MEKRLRLILWITPFVLYSHDALAWGLYTHVYFGQLLVWAVPLLDPAFRRASKRFPRLVMAGTCLPDLALVGKAAGVESFRTTHNWESAQAHLDRAGTDEERALALGFASHLLVDVVAHNHFVPAHERLWFEGAMLSHVASEWAMDAYISRHLFETPGDLLLSQAVVAEYVQQFYGCTSEQTGKALNTLARADQFLRATRLPTGLLAAARRLDRRLVHRFDYYIQQTSSRLEQINRLVAGETPFWQAELPCAKSKREELQAYSRHRVRGRLPVPADFFHIAQND